MDEYLQMLQLEQRQALWEAELDDGTLVYQDDGRPGIYPASAWVRLGDYLRRTGKTIIRLGLRFRTNRLTNILPQKASAYFFSKNDIGFLHSGDTLHFYLLGALQNGKLRVQRWSVPELLLISEEERDPASCGENLIVNPHDEKQVVGKTS